MNMWKRRLITIEPVGEARAAFTAEPETGPRETVPVHAVGVARLVGLLREFETAADGAREGGTVIPPRTLAPVDRAGSTYKRSSRLKRPAVAKADKGNS